MSKSGALSESGDPFDHGESFTMIGDLFATPAREPVFHGRTFPVGTHLAYGDYVVAIRGQDGYDGAEYLIGTQAQIQDGWVQDDWLPINKLFEVYSATLLPPPPPPPTAPVMD
jgi:hypothetical protein